MPTLPTKKNRPWIEKRKPHEVAIKMDWFYNNWKWRKFSSAYKKRHPLCAECEREGIITQTEVTDHLVRYVHGGPGFDLNNLNDEDFQPLCNKHHNSRSGKQTHGYKGK